MSEAKMSANDKTKDGHLGDAISSLSNFKFSTSKNSDPNREVAKLSGKSKDVRQGDAAEVGQSANGKSKDVRQGDAAGAGQSANGKTSNGKTSEPNREVSMVTLVSDDGKSFQVEEDVARKFIIDEIIIKRAIAGEAIPMEKIPSDILEIMIKWEKHHVNDPEPEIEEEDDGQMKRSDDIDDWDLELFNLDIATLFRLMTAANARHMKSLVIVLAKKCANMIKGKSTDEIHEILQIPKRMVEKVGEDAAVVPN